MNQASNQHASTASWRRWSAIVAVLLSVSHVATAKRSLERGVSRNQNHFIRELPYYDYDASPEYKSHLKERKSSKSKGGKSKKKKCKGKKSKGKHSKGDCNEYWSPSEDGGYESTNERPWSPVSQPYPEYPSPTPYHSEHPEPTSHPAPVASAQDSPSVGDWSPSAPYWYYSPSSPAGLDYPTAGAQEDPTSPPVEPTDSPTKDPTLKPTISPTAKPTGSPTPVPVAQSEPQPVYMTIVVPTVAPSESVDVPTIAPSGKYQIRPVERPSIVPTEAPQVKPVEITVVVPTIAPSKGPVPTLAPYGTTAGGSDASPISPSAWWSPVWFPSEFAPTTASWKTESIQTGDEKGAMSTCETTPPDSTKVEVLEFTYEMFVTFGTNNPEVIVGEIERVLHYELSKQLLVCDFGTSSGNVDDFEFTTIVSLPKDTLRNNVCSGTVTIGGTAECYEILGQITVSFIESQRSYDDLIDGMETVMKDLMHGAQVRERDLQQSPLLSVDPAIEGLFFSGFITNDERTGASTQPGSSQAQSSSKTVVGVVSLAAAAVVVVLGGLLLFRRRQSNRYLDVSSDFHSRIGIQARGDSASKATKKRGDVEITDDASDFDLSVYTNTGKSASEDMTPLPDVSGADMGPIGITPRERPMALIDVTPAKEGPSQSNTAHIPIVSPELAKMQEIARLPQESSISIAQSSISIASEDVHPFNDTVDV